MIAVSDEWKRIHQQRILPESFVEITLAVDDDISEDWSTIRRWNSAFFQRTACIVHASIPQPPKFYATLEENLWVLDGSRQILPDSNPGDNTGFVSYDNTFWSDETENGIRVQVELKEVRQTTAPGLTITWSSEYGEYPTTFKIVTFNGDTEVDSVTVTGNSSNVSLVDHEFTGYDVLRLIPLDWNMPNHRVRIDQIFFGQQYVFDKTDILNYTHEQTGDPLSAELSKNSIEFDLNNVDGRWDLLNPTGITRFLCERQALSVRYGLQTSQGVEWINAGVFYLSEWRVSADGLRISFSARDVIDFMLNVDYSRPHRAATVSNTVSTYNTIEDALGSTGSNGTLSNGTAVRIYERYTHLSLGIVDGSMGVVKRHLYRIDQGWVDFSGIVISEDQTMLPDVVAALSTCDIPSLSWSYDPLLQTAKSPIVISENSVAEFLQKCANRCGYTMWQGSDGKLRIATPSKTVTDYLIPKNWAFNHPVIDLAKPLRQLLIVYYYSGTDNSTAVDSDYRPVGVVTVGTSGDTIEIDNPYNWSNLDLFYDSTIQNNLIDAYKKWWSHRGWVTGEFRADPRLELFDVIQVESKYGTISPVMITQIKYTYNGSFRGTYKGKILSADLVETADTTEVT